MIMVPLYAISSLISLFSLGAAFVIDAIRDIYEVGSLTCYVFDSDSKKNALRRKIEPSFLLCWLSQQLHFRTYMY